MGLKERIERLMWIDEPGNREELQISSSLYAEGLRDGAKGSAQLAAEADELMAEMAEALKAYVTAGHGQSTDAWKQGDARQAALYALDKYKEAQND